MRLLDNHDNVADEQDGGVMTAGEVRQCDGWTSLLPVRDKGMDVGRELTVVDGAVRGGDMACHLGEQHRQREGDVELRDARHQRR